MPKTGRSTARIGVGRQLLGLRQGELPLRGGTNPQPSTKGDGDSGPHYALGGIVVSREEGGHSGCSSPENRVCVECGKVFLGRPAEQAHLLKALHRRPLSAAASVQGSGGGGSQAAAAAEAEARAAQSLGLRPRSFSTSRIALAFCGTATAREPPYAPGSANRLRGNREP
jgi:hypothetical protein